MQQLTEIIIKIVLLLLEMVIILFVLVTKPVQFKSDEVITE
jgi:hypothetical protein